jgi:PPOX class probable FMN-dependent enzyme
MIEETSALRALYPDATARALNKQLDRLDAHCVRFIGLSPFVVIASADGSGRLDASPRGGEPGFVHVLDETTLLVPDAPGNNRLDTLTNVVEAGRVGLLFLIPGVDETLRVNGRARLDDRAEVVRRFATEKRTPRLAIEVRVEEAYLHCAKALMRSRLWSDASRVDRGVLPTMGQMIRDQIGATEPAESQAQMLERYAADL